MKKPILVLTTALVCGMMLVGCKTTTVKEDVDNSVYQNLFDKFVVVEERSNAQYGYLTIMYDKDTKVMYYMMTTGSRCGLTPIYNSDGSVMTYEEDN